MRRVEELWGTAIGVEVVDDVGPEVVDALYRWFERVDELFSTWRDDSEISRIGCGELPSRDASLEVATVLALCDDVCRLSAGAFDITFGARAALEPRPGLGPLDPSGLVKGWAVERAATMLLDAGARSFCINAGGDAPVRGRPSSGDAWRIGIQHPWERDKLAAVVRRRWPSPTRNALCRLRASTGIGHPDPPRRATFCVSRTGSAGSSPRRQRRRCRRPVPV